MFQQRVQGNSLSTQVSCNPVFTENKVFEEGKEIPGVFAHYYIGFQLSDLGTYSFI